MELVPLTLLCWHCALVHGGVFSVLKAPLAVLNVAGSAVRYATDKIGATHEEKQTHLGWIQEWSEKKAADIKDEIDKEVLSYCSPKNWDWGHVHEDIVIDKTAKYEDGENVVDSVHLYMTHGNPRTCYVYSGPDYEFTHMKISEKTGGAVEVAMAFSTVIVYKLIPSVGYFLQGRINIKGKFVGEDPNNKSKPEGYCVMGKT